MRREERHHLKANPLAVLLAEARAGLVARGRSVAIGGTVIVAALVIAGAYLWWTQTRTQRAGELLAEAMIVMEAEVIPPPAGPTPAAPAPSADQSASDAPATPDTESDVTEEPQAPASEPPAFVQPTGSYPSVEAKLEAAVPKLLAVAAEYPGTQQAVTARYQAATVLVQLGRADEAVSHYRSVADDSSTELYRQMALMGLAEAHLLTGAPQEAIALLEGQTSAVESLVPVDAVLMRLGRAYQQAGQAEDALAAFNRVVEEFPISVYYGDARQEVEALRPDTGGGATSSQ